MPSVHFEMPDGTTQSATVAVGESVMRAAVNADIPGVVAECGGMLTCATCHVHVVGDWFAKFPPPTFDESDMLEVVDDLRPNSRLSCQLIVDETTDGVAIAVP